MSVWSGWWLVAGGWWLVAGGWISGPRTRGFSFFFALHFFLILLFINFLKFFVWE
jgi:hypothetical protein